MNQIIMHRFDFNSVMKKNIYMSGLCTIIRRYINVIENNKKLHELKFNLKN